MMALKFLGVALAGAVVGCGSSGTAAQATNNDGGSDAGSVSDAAATIVDAGGPIPGLTPQTWTYAPVDGAFCRDGSPTGIAVSPGSGADADKVMIYLEGGGACFNAETCLLNPGSYTYSSWASGTGSSSGVFDRTNAANPVKDWNFVYVPYCTGDVHAGNNPTAVISGVKGTKFVGYENVALDLQRIVPTFPGVTKVLLTGISAGGFGAAANYVQVAKAFGSVPVSLLDDSGPPFEDPYLPRCLQTQMRTLWNLDQTILAECGTDCADPDNYLLAYSRHLGTAYPNIPFGFIDSDQDSVIRTFFGFGLDNCDPPLGTPLDGPTYTAGIEDLRVKLASNTNFGSFIFTGTDHTSLGLPVYYTRTTDTADGDSDAGKTAESVDGGGGPPVTLVQWTTDLIVNGKASNVGP